MAGPYFRKGLLGAAGLLVADQLSKWWILEGLKLPEKGSVELLPFLNFSMVWNRGISMGIPLGESLGKWGIIVLTGLISLWVAKWLFDTVKKMEAWGLALILGGAIGNIIDRFLHGAVVDFVHLHAGGYSFYVFNVADAAITIGVVLLLIDGLRPAAKGPKNAQKVGDGTVDHKGESS
ncbi:signal peptidase II [Kordiimonas lacus]|uniref:signal peptidase II n=1 Tax=Kordiimonas lacus TaxID=637679 RepID=UPI0008374D81|nr:signal peptidase II [Kordiimonas lacus]